MEPTHFNGAFRLLVEGCLQVEFQLVVDTVSFGEVLFGLELDATLLDAFDGDSSHTVFPIFSELEEHFLDFVFSQFVEEGEFYVYVDSVFCEAKESRAFELF
jgi:hypothetical protein